MLCKILTLCILPLILSCQLITSSSYIGGGHLAVDSDALGAEILKIYLPEDHPSSMSIRAPNKEWYIIQDSGSSIVYMPQVEFDDSKHIEFDINTLEGVIWREGIKLREKVFKENGKYLVYFANNLETEPANTFSMSTLVNYQKRY